MYDNNSNFFNLLTQQYIHHNIICNDKFERFLLYNIYGCYIDKGDIWTTYSAYFLFSDASGTLYILSFPIDSLIKLSLSADSL